MTLRPCSTCRRHVRDHERCPFCGAVGVTPAAASPRLTGRLSRAAVFSAATLGGCSSPSPMPPRPHVQEAVVVAAPRDASVMATPPADAPMPVDAGIADATVVGQPPPDAAVAVPVAPQVGTAILRGKVTFADGTPYASRQVSLQGNGFSRGTTTDARGRYELRKLPAGDFTLFVEQDDTPAGRPPALPHKVTLAARSTAVLNVVMPLPVPIIEPVDREPCCKPYGAPPARRRVV